MLLGTELWGERVRDDLAEPLSAAQLCHLPTTSDRRSGACCWGKHTRNTQESRASISVALLGLKQLTACSCEHDVEAVRRFCQANHKATLSGELQLVSKIGALHHCGQ